MEKRQVWLIVLACWIGVFALIGGAWAVVQFWVLDDGPVEASRTSYTTSTPTPSATSTVTALEVTPVLDDTEADLFSSSPSPQPTDVAQAPEPTVEPQDTVKPTSTPAPTSTPRPTATPVPSQTASPAPSPTTKSGSTNTPAPKPTDTPKPEYLQLRYESLGETYSPQVFYSSNRTDKIVPVFDPGRGRRVDSAAFSPGGEHVLMVAAWRNSKTDFGHRLRIENSDGSGGYDILYFNDHNVGGAVQARDMGNAIWSPDGQTIAMWYVEEANNGVYLINSDGTEHRRLDNSQPGDWPRYWSTDGEWIIVINDNGGFFAVDLAETRRVPWESLEGVKLYDQRYFPWRVTGQPECGRDRIVTRQSWWRCW